MTLPKTFNTVDLYCKTRREFEKVVKDKYPTVKLSSYTGEAAVFESVKKRREIVVCLSVGDQRRCGYDVFWKLTDDELAQLPLFAAEHVTTPLLPTEEENKLVNKLQEDWTNTMFLQFVKIVEEVYPSTFSFNKEHNFITFWEKDAQHKYILHLDAPIYKNGRQSHLFDMSAPSSQVEYFWRTVVGAK